MITNQNLSIANKQKRTRQLINNLMASQEVREKVIQQLEKSIKLTI
ncbi:hypothetical protein SAMN05421766_11913 [Zobellia uliginosa]|uniref:Uncharacterized protein n=1 Tax=Zobellia uliginosa TaxID=143224 RepID=A0ABY1L2Y2_9FLAO|nr:hypothetical protein SAMN05421766_11913 [Zobellia uliginosa]